MPFLRLSSNSFSKHDIAETSKFTHMNKMERNIIDFALQDLHDVQVDNRKAARSSIELGDNLGFMLATICPTEVSLSKKRNANLLHSSAAVL